VVAVTNLDREKKMVLDLTELESWWRLFFLGVWTITTMALGYSIGFKEGRREGVVRGKAIGRHAANAVRK
jgi:hypothetical protein